MSYLQMYLLNHGLRKCLAYWINAYNAYTVKLILDNYPTKSIKDIGVKKFFSLGNKNIA
jgi:hypothetical protein